MFPCGQFRSNFPEFIDHVQDFVPFLQNGKEIDYKLKRVKTKKMKVKSMSWTRPEIIVNKFNPSALAHGVEGIFWSWSTKEPERRSALMLKSKNLNRLLYA